MRISLSHSNCVRFECDKLHFIALKSHLTFIVGISIYQERCSILGGGPDIQTCPSHPAALLAALAIVPTTCAERLKIPNERPDISSTVEGDIIAGGDGGGGNGGVGGAVVIASR